jgi:hypothetical protein
MESRAVVLAVDSFGRLGASIIGITVLWFDALDFARFLKTDCGGSSGEQNSQLIRRFELWSTNLR